MQLRLHCPAPSTERPPVHLKHFLPSVVQARQYFIHGSVVRHLLGCRPLTLRLHDLITCSRTAAKAQQAQQATKGMAYPCRQQLRPSRGNLRSNHGSCDSLHCSSLLTYTVHPSRHCASKGAGSTAANLTRDVALVGTGPRPTVHAAHLKSAPQQGTWKGHV